MKRRDSVALLFGLSVLACKARNPASSGTSASTGIDSAAVMAASEQYRHAWIRGDTAAALSRVSNDIRILISGVPDIVGREATRKVFVDEMTTYDVPMLDLHHEELIVGGDHAIDIGTYDEIQMPKKHAPPIHGRGRFMTIWRREGAEWRIICYMLNDLPDSAAH
jgi:ketosteroid isomerase-like protein